MRWDKQYKKKRIDKIRRKTLVTLLHVHKKVKFEGITRREEQFREGDESKTER